MANRMKSALFIILVLKMLLLLFICDLRLCEANPLPLSSSSSSTSSSSGKGLSYQEREELYRQTPAVPDERMADAELDNAYELFNLKPQRPTKPSTIYLY